MITNNGYQGELMDEVCRTFNNIWGPCTSCTMRKVTDEKIQHDYIINGYKLTRDDFAERLLTLPKVENVTFSRSFKNGRIKNLGEMLDCYKLIPHVESIGVETVIFADTAPEIYFFVKNLYGKFFDDGTTVSFEKETGTVFATGPMAGIDLLCDENGKGDGIIDFLGSCSICQIIEALGYLTDNQESKVRFIKQYNRPANIDTIVYTKSALSLPGTVQKLKNFYRDAEPSLLPFFFQNVFGKYTISEELKFLFPHFEITKISQNVYNIGGCCTAHIYANGIELTSQLNGQTWSIAPDIYNADFSFQRLLFQNL